MYVFKRNVKKLDFDYRFVKTILPKVIKAAV